jgi:glutamine amidotransferase
MAADAKMIGIVDYGMGNLLSVRSAFEYLGADVQLCTEPEALQQAERIVLPGVGAFADCMGNLGDRGFIEALGTLVMQKGTPILGICLGMQAMARRSEEGAPCDGLGWIAADVVRLSPADVSCRIPHVGWNETEYRPDSPCFAGLPTCPDFYFVHSYHMQCDDSETVDATCNHGQTVTAAVRFRNIFATQFHPERSQDYGLRVLDNFLSWSP